MVLSSCRQQKITIHCWWMCCVKRWNANGKKWQILTCTSLIPSQLWVKLCIHKWVMERPHVIIIIVTVNLMDNVCMWCFATTGDRRGPGRIHICSTIRQSDELLYCTARTIWQWGLPGRWWKHQISSLLWQWRGTTSNNILKMLSGFYRTQGCGPCHKWIV